MKSEGRERGAWLEGKGVLALRGCTFASGVNCFTLRIQGPPLKNSNNPISFCHVGKGGYLFPLSRLLVRIPVTSTTHVYSM